MKKFILLIALIGVLLSCAERNSSNKYTIDGAVAVDSLNGKWVYLFGSNKMDSLIASAEIVDNKFHISNSTMVHPYSGPLVVGDEKGNLYKPYIGSSIIIEPGNIKVNIPESGGTVKISGTPLNDMFYQCEYASIRYDSICSAVHESKLSVETKRYIMDSLKVATANNIYSALTDNTNWKVTNDVLNLTFLRMNSAQLSDIVTKTLPEMKNKRLFKVIEDGMYTTVGNQYVDVKLNNINGDSVYLKDYIGKSDYTLLVFWGSWCGPCLRAIRKFGKLYNSTDREQFDIVAISLDKEKDKWKKAVNKGEQKWTQLSSLRGWECESAVKYGINFVPSTVLIDRSGKIVARSPKIEEVEIYVGK